MTPSKHRKLFTLSLAGALAAFAGISGAHAEVGTGWVPWFPTTYLDIESSNVHTHHDLTDYLLYNGAEYSFDSATSTETFKLLTTDSNRLERAGDEHYTSGARQMEGDLKIHSLSSQNVHQIFHGTTGPIVLVEGFGSNGGELRKYSGPTILASGIDNVWLRYNNLHQVGSYLQIYINGTKMYDGAGAPADGAGNTNKYGLYGTKVTTDPTVQWRNVKWYKDGTPAYFKILNRNSGKALNVEGNSTTDGAKVIQWPYSDDSRTNDEWQIISVGNGYVRIMARHSGKALNVSGASTADGAEVIQWPYTSSSPTNDEWEICGVAGGYYRIINRNSGKALNVSGASLDDGAQVIQWPYSANSLTNDEWEITNIP